MRFLTQTGKLRRKLGAYILCSGQLAEHPYKIAETGLLIYSAEELSYYIFNSFYLIDENFVSEELISFIELELKLPESAKRIRKARDERVSMAALLMTILREYHYYSEGELKEFQSRYESYRHQSAACRKARKADYLLENGHYLAAIQIYRQFLHARKDTSVSGDFYMKVMQHMAVCYVWLGLMDEALEAYVLAYKENPDEILLKQIFQFSCMSGLPLPANLYKAITPENEKKWREMYEEVRDQGSLLASTGSTAGLFTKDSVRRREALKKHIDGIKKEYRKAIS